jgi:hypothetical protein
MKTKPITVTLNVPDDNKSYNITALVADATPAGQSDHDRVREITRKVWVVGAGETTVQPVG